MMHTLIATRTLVILLIIMYPQVVNERKTNKVRQGYTEA